MEGQLYDELLVELECPICTNYMSPPIQQCATGHSVCETCRKKLPRCALCQGKFTSARNLSLEGLAVKMHYPCINRPSGCVARLSYTEREVHELRCTMKGFKCPMERCQWIGKIEDVANHWASKKTSSKPYHKNNICHTKIKSESYYVNIVEAYNKLFWFKCKLTKNKLYWAVQFVGNGAEAEKYYYEIDIFKPGHTKQRILISNYCQSVELDNSELFEDDMCISANVEYINNFVGEDQLLIYYMRVYVVENEEPQLNQPAGRAPNVNKDKAGKQRDRSKGPSAHGNKDHKKQLQAKGSK